MLVVESSDVREKDAGQLEVQQSADILRQILWRIGYFCFARGRETVLLKYDSATMSSLEIVLHPHPALRWKCKDVARIDAGLRVMVEQMFELMYAARGIGLAANQVGLPYRLFVINPAGDKDEKDQEFVFINPQITRKKGSETDEEGCLSLPEVFGPVTRATKIIVDAFDLAGKQFELELQDLPARVVQHEYDHVEGIMFTDRVPPAALQKMQPLIADFESQFRNRQKEGLVPSDEKLKAKLRELEKARAI